MTENKIPGWADVYTKPVEPPKQAVTTGGSTDLTESAWVNSARLRILKITNPEAYVRIVRAQVNREPVDIDAVLRGEA